MKLLCLGIAVIGTCGCHHLTTRPINVVVLDAELGEPIPDAKVEAWYQLLWEETYYLPILRNLRITKHRITGEAGSTTILAPQSVAISASAAGYLTPNLTWGEQIVPLNPKLVDGQAIIRLYRAPEPTITIVVPDGYRGPLLVEKKPVHDWVQGRVGQREFVFYANENGYVGISATPLLMVFDGSTSRRLRVRYANGADVPDWRGEDDVALRWVQSFETKWIFVVGTEDDEDKMSSLIYLYSPPNHQSMNGEAIEKMFFEADERPVTAAKHTDVKKR